MAEKKLLLPEIPYWLTFIERYQGRIDLFAAEVVGILFSQQQADLYTSVAISRSRTSVVSGHGCFAKGTSIMLSNGDCVPVENIKVGDRLMGDDGCSERAVLELKRGREKLYKFTYNDGTSHVFNESHILCLVATNSKGTRKSGDKKTVTVKEWLTWGYDKKRCHAIYRNGVNEFFRDKKELAVPPYILGLWLGDGTSSKPEFTTADNEIINEISNYAKSIGCNLGFAKNSNKSFRLSITRKSKKILTNLFIANLRNLGVFENKYIPDDYLYSDMEGRLELLAGLIDTDGYRDRTSYEITQKSEKLAKQIAWLARSVGCHATLNKIQKTCCNNGKVGDYWVIRISRNAHIIPVRIDRKKITNPNRQRPNLYFGIKNCEPLGDGDYYGFVLDGNNKFLGGDFTVLHNTGKTSGGLAVIVLWHLLCYPESVTLVTANDMDQLKSTLWKEISIMVERIRKGLHGWIAEHIEVMADATARIIGFEKTWFIESKTANEKTANKMAGRHGQWLLIIGDEASTIPDLVLTTLSGALTDEHNRFLLTSQGTRNAGFFYRTQHDLAIENGGEWTALQFNSFESPWVSDRALKELWDQYDEDERNVRLLGRFPQDSSKHMMNRKAAEAMYKRGRIIKDHENYGWLVLGDIAGGEGLRDKSACVLARVIGYGDIGDDARRVEIVKIPLLTNKIRSNVFSHYMIDEGADLHNATYVVDAGGLGINVCQDLEDANILLKRVYWGQVCWSKSNQLRYTNLRAQASHQAARAAKDGRLSILTYDYKNVMIDQSSRIPKNFDGKGRIIVPPKHSKEWDGLGSPDLWDAVCFAFLEDVKYIVCEHGKTNNEKQLVNELIEQVDDLFADVA